MTSTVSEEEKIKAAFFECQKTKGAHTKAVQTIKSLLKSANEEKRTETQTMIWNEICKFMPIQKKDVAIERLIQFVGTLAGSLGDNFCVFLLHQLCSSSHASEKSIRLRSSQLISSVLNSLPENAEIEEEVFHEVLECMLERIKDKNPGVRTQAASALARLQDPDSTSNDDPVISEFRRMLETDPSPNVRKAILEDISVTPITVSDIVKRTRDVSEIVRSTAYDVIASKIDMRSVSVKQRAALVRQGIGDRSETVRKSCIEMIRNAWLPTAADSNPLSLISMLNPEEFPNESESVAKCIVGGSKSLLTTTQLSPVSKPIHLPLVATEQISPELSLLWRIFNESHNGGDGDDYDETNHHQQITLTQLSEIITAHRKEIYICSQLLIGSCTSANSSCDEAGKTKLLNAVVSLLSSLETDEKLVEPSLKTLSLTIGQPAEEKVVLNQIINDLQVSCIDKKESAVIEVEKLRSMLRRAQLVHFLLMSCPEELSQSEIDKGVQEIILPCVQCPDSNVRQMGIRALSISTIVSSASKEYSPETHVKILLHALNNDQGNVQCSAAEGIFDIIVTIGINELPSDIINELAEHLSIEEQRDTLASIVEGFAKLFFQDIISNKPEILSKLIVLLHHSKSHKPAKLRQCLSVFFPAFLSGNSAKEHIRQLQDAILPALVWANDVELATKVSEFVFPLVQSASSAAGISGVMESISLTIAEMALRECSGADGPICRICCQVLTLCFSRLLEVETTQKLKSLVSKILTKSDDVNVKKSLQKVNKLLSKAKETQVTPSIEDENEENEQEMQPQEQESTSSLSATTTTITGDEKKPEATQEPPKEVEEDKKPEKVAIETPPEQTPTKPIPKEKTEIESVEQHPAASTTMKSKAKKPKKTTAATKGKTKSKSRNKKSSEDESDNSVEIFSDVSDKSESETEEPIEVIVSKSKQKKATSTKTKASTKSKSKKATSEDDSSEEEKESKNKKKTTTKKTATETKKKKKKCEKEEQSDSEISVDVFSDAEISDSNNKPGTTKPKGKTKPTEIAPTKKKGKAKKVSKKENEETSTIPSETPKLKRLVRNSAKQQDEESDT